MKKSIAGEIIENAKFVKADFKTLTDYEALQIAIGIRSLEFKLQDEKDRDEINGLLVSINENISSISSIADSLNEIGVNLKVVNS